MASIHDWTRRGGPAADVVTGHDRADDVPRHTRSRLGPAREPKQLLDAPVDAEAGSADPSTREGSDQTAGFVRPARWRMRPTTNVPTKSTMPTAASHMRPSNTNPTMANTAQAISNTTMSVHMLQRYACP